jgi:hypothetical protein
MPRRARRSPANVPDQNIAILAAELVGSREKGTPDVQEASYSDLLDLAIDAAWILTGREVYWRDPGVAWDALDWYQTTDAIVGELLRGATPYDAVTMALADRMRLVDYYPKGDRNPHRLNGALVK